MRPAKWHGSQQSYGPLPPSQSAPEMPKPPYQSVTNYQTPDLASRYIQPRRHWVLPLLAIIILSGLTFGVTKAWRSYQNNPNHIFQAAFTSALQTDYVTVQTTSNNVDTSVNYDVSSPANPRIDSITTKSFGANSYIKGWGSLQNTYMAYGSNPKATSNTPLNLLDRWIQIRKSGQLPERTDGSAFISTVDPRNTLLGPWLNAHFAKKDREALLDFAQQNHLYSFDTKKVRTQAIAGHSTLIYSVKVNGSKLAEYNKKAAILFHLLPQDTSQQLKNLSTTTSLTIFVQKDTKQVSRIETAMSGLKTTFDYNNYGNKKIAAEPKADLSYNDFFKQLNE